VGGVSSEVAADLQSDGFSKLEGRRAGTDRDLDTGSGLGRPCDGKSHRATILSVIGTVLAITAGPVLASLLERPSLSHALYNSSVQLRGPITFNAYSDFQLRGSIR
jgi:hypothetical protein